MSDAISQLPLIIQENICFYIEALPIEVISYLGTLTPEIDYFQVRIISDAKLGLLRIGATDGALNRELLLRNQLGDYKLVSRILLHRVEENVAVDTNVNTITSDIFDGVSDPLLSTNLEDHNLENGTTPLTEPGQEINDDKEYLEEEYYPEAEILVNVSNEKLLVLSYLPDENQSLEHWLKTEHDLEQSLLITSQICQVFRYLHQRKWCILNFVPRFIQMGTLIQFFDLTSVYPLGEVLKCGFMGNYYAPELAYSKDPIEEKMSSYAVGALLYQIIHRQNLPTDPTKQIEINPIPQIYQILKICLSQLPEERFTLEQLLKILVNTRQEITIPKVNWETASLSTLGLSINRLQNEDNYGIKQHKNGDRLTVMLAGIADGMGGMSQGELASRLAIETILRSPIPLENLTKEQYQEWLQSLFVEAHDRVSDQIKNGGTTLSVILALSQELMIAHVGDSRIYLLRQGEMRQLSEDHSLVAILLASGKITEEELSNHPDRNILTKSIGWKGRLSAGYVQDLQQTTSKLTMKLEHGDILLLCSDGVWDLVSKNQLATNFTTESNLQTAVNLTIDQVLQEGATDNATLLALRFSVTDCLKT